MMYKHVSVCRHVLISAGTLQRQGASDLLGAGVTGGYELPDTVSWKNALSF